MSDPRYVYFNTTVANGSVSTTFGSDTTAKYSTTRTGEPLVADASKYDLTIVRATVNGPGALLPVWMPVIQTGQSNVNLTTNSVTLTAQWRGAADDCTTGQVVVQAGINDTFLLQAKDSLGMWVDRGTICSIASASYADASAYAAAVQTAVQAAATRYASVTVALDAVSGKLVFTANHAPWSLGVSFAPTPLVVPDLLAATAATMGGINGQTFWTPLASAAATTVTLPNCPYAPDGGQIAESPVFVGRAYIIWEPEDLSAPTPAAPTTQQDISSTYYYCFALQHLTKLWNAAWQSALDAVTTQAQAWWVAQGFVQPSNLFPGWTSLAPQLTYDGATGLFTLHVDRYSAGSSALGRAATSVGYVNQAQETFQFYQSEETQAMFNAWSTLTQSFTSELQSGMDYMFDLDGATPSTMPSDGTTPAWALTEEFVSTASSFSPVACLVVQSNLLPFLPEQTMPSTIYGQSSASWVPSAGNAVTNAITDLVVAADRATDIRGLITYIPPVYRWSDCGPSRSAVKALDFQISWRNRLTGATVPLVMPPQSSIELKGCFRLKGVSQ
jgi:hypothetical protein